MTTVAAEETSPPPAEEVRAELEKILASGAFRDSQRATRLLRFLVEETLAGRSHLLKEFTLGADGLGRGPTFDPRADPIARVEASRLRSRLEGYFASTGAPDPILIVLPKGGYVPQFSRRTALHGAVPAPRPERAARWLLLGGLFGIAISAAVMYLLRGTTSEAPNLARGEPKQLEIDVGADGVIGSEVGVDMALTPDGKELVFVSLQSDGSTRLFARSFSQLRARELPGTYGARGPVVSRDGRWVAFWSDHALRKTRLDGTGSPSMICDAPDLLGASWAEDGTIVAALGSQGLWRIDAESGRRSMLASTAERSRLVWPQSLPGGRLVLATEISGPISNTSLDVIDVQSGERRTVVRGGTYGRYVPTGHLVYVNSGTLFAIPFDLRTLTTRGPAIPVLQDVSYSPTFGYAQIDFANDGTFVYRRAEAGGRSLLRWLDVDGKTRPLMASAGHYQWVRLSPDARRVAFTLQEADRYNLWVGDVMSGTKTRLGDTASDYLSPVWTPDSRFIIHGTADGIGWIAADGSRQGRLLAGDAHAVMAPWSVAPDGRTLAYYAMGASTGFDLWTVPLETSAEGVRAGEPRPLRNTPAFEVYPTFAPDGPWLAYASNESGSWEVYVLDPESGRQWRASQGGGRIPAWSRAGQKLFYETDDHRVMVVSYSVEHGELNLSQPAQWSDKRLADTGVIANFDVTADGRSIAALMPVEESPSARNHVVLITGFLDAL